MVTLTIVCCLAVLFTAIALFNNELDNAVQSKVEVAINVVYHEIAEMQAKALLAVLTMSSNQDLIDALSDNDQEKATQTASALQVMSALDYCMIIDKNGTILARTDDPDNTGINFALMPHVSSALNGIAGTYIIQGPTIRLGASAGAPVYDDAGDLIGVVTLGFMLNKQNFTYRLRELTGCEISLFSGDERVSSTILNEDYTYVLGEHADPSVSSAVLAGERYMTRGQLFGRDAIMLYAPLFGVNDQIIGMIGVGYYTEEDTLKINYFIGVGLLVTLAVLGFCLIIARYLSGVIERRLGRMMSEIEERDTLLLTVNTVAMLLLTAKDSGDIESSINEGMELIGHAIGVDRINIWRSVMKNNEPEYHRDYSWLSESVLNKRWLPYTLRNLSALGWTDTFYRKECIIGTITNMSETEQEFLNTYEMMSVVIIPLFLDDEFWGLFSVESCFIEKEFTEDEINILHSVSLMMATNINHHFMRRRMNEANERTSYMFNTNPQVNILFNSAFNIIDCNPAAMSFLKVKSKTQMILGFYDIIDRCTPEFQRDGSKTIPLHEYLAAAANRGSVKYETELILDGVSKILDVELRRIPYENSYAIVAYVFDVTVEKNTALELERRREEAESANVTKSAFLANMSHEIRTPMNSIIGFAELAADDELPVRTAEYLDNITNSAKWLLLIINDILDLSKIESGKMDLEKIPFDLPLVFEHCQSIIIPKAVEKGIMLYCYAEPSIGKKLLGDPIRLRQVITNILSNAVKFTNVGTIKLLASIKESVNDKITIYFEIKDSGIGMTPEQIERIYEPFTQADDTISRRFGGTGLGLAITKNIIELMGGTLQAESTVGVGSKFSFELTFDVIDDISDVPSKDIVVNEYEKPHFKGEVLVCEDNSLNQKLISEHLARVGLKVVIANNGKEGLDIVEERITRAENEKPKDANDSNMKYKPFDLILMDIHMPVMDGLEAASKITELGVKTPIVAVTANIMSSDMEFYKNSGMYDTLGKPFTSGELWKCLIKYIPVESYSTISKHSQMVIDEDLIKQLSLNFVRDNQTTYADIIGALDSGDIKAAHRLAHALKGNAGQIKKNQLQTAAAVVEEMLKDGENRLNTEQLSILKAEIDHVLNDLAPLLAEFEVQKQDKITDEEKIREIFDKLEPLLKLKSLDCEEFLNEIHRIEGAGALADYIEDFNYKQALNELNKLKHTRGWSD